MVRKKPTATVRRSHRLEPETPMAVPSSMVNETPPTPPHRRRSFIKIAAVVLVVAAVLALLARNRSLLLAGVVNGRPIFIWELNQRLSHRFGAQMFDMMVGEYLIYDAARKQNVTVTADELNSRISEIEKSYAGSMPLEESLKLQGISRSDFTNQVELQLLIDKMLSQEVSVSATEVDEYLKANTANLTATTEAEKRVEAEKEVRNNKLSQTFNTWFTKLKEEAKITRYL